MLPMGKDIVLRYSALESIQGIRIGRVVECQEILNRKACVRLTEKTTMHYDRKPFKDRQEEEFYLERLAVG